MPPLPHAGGSAADSAGLSVACRSLRRIRIPAVNSSVRFGSGFDDQAAGNDQPPQAPDVTVTSTVEANASLVTTNRMAPAAETALPPVTLVQ